MRYNSCLTDHDHDQIFFCRYFGCYQALDSGEIADALSFLAPDYKCFRKVYRGGNLKKTQLCLESQIKRSFSENVAMIVSVEESSRNEGKKSKTQ